LKPLTIAVEGGGPGVVAPIEGETTLSDPRVTEPRGGVSAAAAGRVPELDGIRGLAILSVLAYHWLWGYREYFQTSPLGHYLTRVTRLGWIGVDLFFVLSGFLIGGILFDNNKAKNYFPVFYGRRACRILPAYAVMLALGVIVTASSPGSELVREFFAPRGVDGWTYPLFFQNVAMAFVGTWGSAYLSVTWSLAIEEQFYLLLPLAIRRIHGRQLIGTLVVVALSAPVVRLLLWSFGGLIGMHNRIASLVLLPARADALLTGAVLAILWRKARFRRLVAEEGRFLSAACWVCAIGLAGLLVENPEPGSALMAVGGLSFVAIACAVVLLMSLREGSVTSRLMRTGWLRWSGRRCYSLYLFHSVVMIAAMKSDLFRWHDAAILAEVRWAIGAAATLLLAELMGRAVEDPAIRVGWRLKYLS
jgi:peptidoglycan/LPS O-acetylase OafA/YrhL